MTPDRTKVVRDLLAFYAEAGVDAAVGEVANDWLSNDSPSLAFPSASSPPANTPLPHSQRRR